MRKPLVSIIISVYNEEDYIQKCLESLLIQSYQPLEILVADDGSTDKTAQLVEKLKVKLYKRSHIGFMKQLNFLAKKAKGKILVRLDGDMYYDKDYILDMVSPIIKGAAIATFSKEEYVANIDNVWASCWSINAGLTDNRLIPADVPDRTWNFRAILKDKFFEVGGFDEDKGYGGDDGTVMKKLGKPLGIAAPGAVSYHYNPSTLSEVFTSSRWIGRGEWFIKNPVKWLLIFSPLNSLRNGIVKAVKTKNPHFIIFKFIFDFGASAGILERLITGKHIK